MSKRRVRRSLARASERVLTPNLASPRKPGSQAAGDLEKAMQLGRGRQAHNCFFLAMAHWQRKEWEKARQWYDRAIRWIEKNKPDDPGILQFRAEAAQLLGLADAKAPVKKDGK